MIEHVLERCIKFQAGAFIQLEVFKYRQIGDVGYVILREIAASAKRRAKNALLSGCVDDVADGILLHRCAIQPVLYILIERDQLGWGQSAGTAEVVARVTGKDANRGGRSVQVTNKWPGHINSDVVGQEREVIVVAGSS